MTVREEVLTRIDVWCAATGTSPRQLGYKACNSGNAVRRLRRGESVTLDTVDKLIAFMSDNPITAQPL